MPIATPTVSAPVLTSATPADNTGSVQTGANIVLNFSSAMRAGSGYITISDGATQTYMGRDGLMHTRLVGATDTRTISIADASQVTINGNQVTINLSSDLKAGLTYSVQMGSGVLLGESGLAYAGLADASKLNFAVSAASVPLPTAVVDTLSMVSWGSVSPFLTNIADQHFSGTFQGALRSGDKVEVSIDGQTWHTATVNGNSWSYDATIAASGTLRARVSNSAGASTEALSQAYTYDTTGPVISSISLDKEALSVGESARLTVVFSEKVSGLTLEAFGKHNSMLSSLEASADGKTWTAVVTMGNEGLPGGDVALNPAAVRDGAGNYGSGGWNTVTYGRKPGSLAERSVTLDAGSDSGQQSDDGLTSDSTPEVHLNIRGLAGLMTGDIIKIYDEASDKVVGSHTLTEYDFGAYGGTIDIDVDTLAEGAHHLVAYASDALGTRGAGTGTALEVVVDTSGPEIIHTAPANNGPAVDPGLKTITLTFSEDIAWTASNGIAIVGSDDSVLEISFETPPPTGEQVADYNYLSYDSATRVLTINLFNPLAAGKGYTVRSIGEIKDLAHNAYAGSDNLVGFLINGESQVIPLPPTLSISDTGAAGDGVTSNAIVTVSGITAGYWKYSLDGGASYSAEQRADGGAVSFSVPNDGTYLAGKILVKQYHAAGQESDAGALGFDLTLDRSAPQAAVTSINNFNQNATAISGTYAGALQEGEYIEYSLDGSNWVQATAGNGSWSAAGVELNQSHGTIDLRVIDRAGNIADNPYGAGNSPTLFGSSGNDALGASAETVLLAGAGNDTVTLAGTDVRMLDGGAGIDTLVLSNSLNLNNLTGTIDNFESITLGSNVTFSLGNLAGLDALHLPSSLIPGFDLLKVEGAENSRVELAGAIGWQELTLINVGLLGFNAISDLLGGHEIYVNQNAQLIVVVGAPSVDIASLL
jgi:methionine-rich copper-binding protein CopC